MFCLCCTFSAVLIALYPCLEGSDVVGCYNVGLHCIVAEEGGGGAAGREGGSSVGPRPQHGQHYPGPVHCDNCDYKSDCMEIVSDFLLKKF